MKKSPARRTSLVKGGSLLAEPDEEAWLQRFRRATCAGNPLGTDEFVEKVKAGQAMPGDLLATTTAIGVATSVR